MMQNRLSSPTKLSAMAVKPHSLSKEIYIIFALQKNNHNRSSVLDANESHGPLPRARVNYFEAVLRDVI